MAAKRLLILQNTILHYRKALYNELAKYYEVVVLHSGSNTVSDAESYAEIVTRKKSYGPFFLQQGVLSEVRSDKYDAIIAMCDPRWINSVLASFIHNRRAKFIWWGAWLTNSLVANKVRLFLSNRGHASVFYTHEAKAAFVEAGVDEKKLFVANNTIDVGARQKSYEHPNKFRILMVGSLDKRKRCDVLIEAFYSIRGRIDPAIKLTLIGAGKELTQLKSLVAKLKLEDDVVFEGSITKTDELARYYSEAIVSVSFGQAGLAVLQGLGNGVPFITKTNAISGGEKTNIKDGVNGFFCEDCQESLAAKLVKLCNDMPMARELGKNAYNYYSEYCTIENMAQGLRDAVEDTRLSK